MTPVPARGRLGAAHARPGGEHGPAVARSRRYRQVVFEYLERRPDAPLGRFVESLWYARGHITGTRERIAPTGSTVAAVVLAAPIRQVPAGATQAFVARTGFLIGPHDRPLVNEPEGETYCVGMVLTPLACRPVLGVEPASVRGRVVDLLTAWPPAPSLRAELLACESASESLVALERALGTPTPRDPVAFDRCEAAVRHLAADPARPIADIAAGLGVSHGHLDRQFTREVGLSPRTLARILRMRSLLDGIDVHAPVRWADRAAALGWTDQAHLIRDFKRHTGVTPSEYVAAQRATYEPDVAASSAGFVPER